MTPDDELIHPGPAGGGPDPELDRAGVSGTGASRRARVLRAPGVVDAAAAAELRRDTGALLARSPDPIVIDLTAVRDVGPTASGVLRDLAYEAGDADVDLRVVRPPGASAATRALLDDEALYELYPTLDAALRRRVRSGGPPPSDR